MMREMHMLITFSALALIPISSYAEDRCQSCHAQKSSQAYVDTALHKESAHGSLSCVSCHLGIIDYPHRKGSRVKCGVCHFLGKQGAPREEAREYTLSVHGKAMRRGDTEVPDCQTCHGSHYIFPSRDVRSQTVRRNIPSLCSGCHRIEYEVYVTSIHGQAFLARGNNRAAICTDCHMEHHLIEPIKEPGWKLFLIKECGRCHSVELDTYRKTFHGKVSQLGYPTVAKCSDCHGSHTILPVHDKGSTLSEQNRVTTCRTCHPRATRRFADFYSHPDEHNRVTYPLLYYVYLFMTLLLTGVFTFFFFHTVLWTYRAAKERRQTRRETR
jgi:hypothetical protein